MKFFQKVRFGLMGNNNLGKYLKYAIGEIFLVVIGILIALEINTINQNWIESKEEQKVLHNLKTDFDYNLIAINGLVKDTEDKIHSNSLLLKLTGPNTPNPKKLNIDSLLGKAAGVPIFLPREGFLDELINSGNLEIIKSDHLRNKLSIWKPSLTHLKNREESTLYTMIRTGEYINMHGSWINIDQHNPQMKSLVPAPSFDTDNKELLKSQEFQNNLDNDFWSLNVLMSQQKDIIKINEEILTIINQEIK